MCNSTVSAPDHCLFIYYSKIGKHMGTPEKFNTCRKTLDDFNGNVVK